MEVKDMYDYELKSIGNVEVKEFCLLVMDIN